MDCLLDTGAMFSVLMERDADHAMARAFLRTPRLRLFSTAAMMGELYTLSRRRVGYQAARAAIVRIEGDPTIDIFQMEPPLDRETWAVIDEFAGVPLSYVDASLVALGRRLRIASVFSFDDDLRRAGLTLVPGGAG